MSVSDVIMWVCLVSNVGVSDVNDVGVSDVEDVGASHVSDVDVSRVCRCSRGIVSVMLVMRCCCKSCLL